MMTLSIDGSSMPQGEENAALLSPCRIRSAAFCGNPELLEQLTR
jgi:hypothetical protein